ncbi:uncharacterized protein LOC132751541, partial [Ruditapes philippinarum]|uniref:uncharacterized protein LOC132751541 n=1 Tax=Ruditapes philippinarum TaxID=129788 RepID=UPI00295C39F1
MRDGFHSNDRSSIKMNTGKKMYYLRIQVLLVDGGTMVLRKIFDEKASPLAACLKQHQGTLAFLSKRNIINKQQYLLISSNAPTSASFDISLLSCLLRNICRLKGSTDPCWSTPPAPTDFSIEADLVRFRAYRNEFAHTSSTSALSENDFNMKWTDIVQVLIRLNYHLQNGVPNLQLELGNMKTAPLDEEADKRYQQEIDQWHQMDSAQTRDIEVMSSEIKDLNTNIETLSLENRQQRVEMSDKHDEVIKHVKSIPKNKHFSLRMTAEQKNLYDSSQMYFDDAKGKKKYYVRTNIYTEASKQLKTSGIAILSGHPGDGKTLMANCLLMEMVHEKKLLRLTRPDDWRLVDFDVYTAVLIDDIFGNAVLDENLLKKWEVFLIDIRNAANQRELSFVITTRHYIMQEAKVKLHDRADMFNGKNVTILFSSRLTQEEKYKILQAHLMKNKREIQTNSSMYESIETHWERVTKTSNKVLTVGFPECASMFASSDILFDKGIEFFSSPLEFFQKCIQDISKDEDEFMPLVLVWLKTPGKLVINNFNIGENRKQLQKLEEEFGYPFHKKAKEIKKCLDSHRDEFLVFSTKTGEYSFSHSVISDVVGIVCAREYTDAILKHASKDFIMKYVKTLPCCKDDLIIYIEEYQFNGLIEKFNQLLHMTEDDTQGFLFDNDFFIKPRVDGIENTIICSHFLMSNSVLKHDAFENKDFIKKFVENARVKGGQDKRVNKTL